MARGRRGRRAGRRGGRGRRLVDPAVEVDYDALIKLLKKTHRVHEDELLPYRRVPDQYQNETPAVQAMNRGVNTIYGKSSHLRRRFLNLMLNGKEDSEEGDYIQAKLAVFAKEVVLLHNQIEAMGGVYYPLPRAFTRPMALLN